MTQPNSKPSFPATPGLYKYNYAGQEIELFLDAHVCPPSEFGLLFRQHLTVEKEQTVIDVGTGSGLLAICAAKQGATVFATEPNSRAAKIARQNFERNDVQVELRQGEYFADFERQFDVIIANLPQEIIPPAMKKVWSKEIVEGIDGGDGGNKHVLELLERAPGHMHNDSRLVIVAYTGAFYDDILRAASEDFEVETLGKKSGQVRDFIETEKEFFEPLIKQEKILLHEEDGHLYADGIFLSLKKKKGSPSAR